MWEKLATETPLKVEYIQNLWDFWIKERPNYAEFLKRTLPVVMAVSGNFEPFLASGVATTLWEKFQEVDEALKVPSTFSELSLTELQSTTCCQRAITLSVAVVLQGQVLRYFFKTRVRKHWGVICATTITLQHQRTLFKIKNCV